MYLFNDIIRTNLDQKIVAGGIVLYCIAVVVVIVIVVVYCIEQLIFIYTPINVSLLSRTLSTLFVLITIFQAQHPLLPQ